MTLLLVHTALWSAALIILLLAALTDLHARIIPNQLVLAIAAIGLLLGVAARPQSLWINLLCALLLLVGLGTLAYQHVLGAGDAKLMAAVTLLVPPEHIGPLLFAIALIGGLVSAGYLAAHHVLKHYRPRRHGVAARQSAFVRWQYRTRARVVYGRSVPYALAIFGGTVMYVLSSELHLCLSATSCSL